MDHSRVIFNYNEQDEASSKSSRTNSTDFSRLSRTQKRKKATNRYYIILAGCIFVAALLVVCVIVSLSRKSKPEPNDSSVSTIHTVESPSSYPSVSNRVLPSVENFEQHLANEINDFFAASVIDAEYSGYGIKNYEIPHCSREDGFTSDQAIFCGYGPNSVMGLVATVTGEEVTYVDTMFVLSGAEETEDVLSGIPMLMIPVALFNSNYSDMKK